MAYEGFEEIKDREFGWDDEIENDSPDFVVLPAGDYDFEVVEFERGRHAGSEKLPPCNKAVVHIRVSGLAGVSTIKHNLFLHSKTEGMLCAFFAGIGQRQKGEKLKMNWNAVVGSKGRCRVGVRKWKTDDGKELEGNDIKKFYEPEEAPAQQAGFTPGEF